MVFTDRQMDRQTDVQTNIIGTDERPLLAAEMYQAIQVQVSNSLSQSNLTPNPKKRDNTLPHRPNSTQHDYPSESGLDPIDCNHHIGPGIELFK